MCVYMHRACPLKVNTGKGNRSMTWVHTCKCRGNIFFFFLDKQVSLEPLVSFGFQSVKYIYKVAKVLKEFLLGGMNSNTF